VDNDTQRQNTRDIQDQPAAAEKDGATLSRRDVLAAGAKVTAGGAALAAGLGTGLGRAPTVVRAASTITLRYMHWETTLTNQSKFWMDILAGFTKLHPGVVIQNNFVPGAQYLPTLTAMAAAKTLPDMFHAHVLAAQLGRAGLTVNYKDYFPVSFFTQFYPSTVRQFTFDNGKVYALPLIAQTIGIFPNTKIMSQLHLQTPETWDDLIAMTPAIRKAGLTPLAWGNAQSNSGPDFFLPLITQYGGDVYALDDLTKPGVSWNSKPVIEAFTLLKRLVDAKAFPNGINGISQSPQAEALAFHGQAAMLWDGSWAPPIFKLQAPQSWLQGYTVARIPALTRGGRHWCGNGSGAAPAVNNHGPHRDLALEFIRYLFSPTVYNTFIKESQQFPSESSAISQISDPVIRTMVSWLPDGTDHILFGTGSWNAVSNAVTGILQGSLSPTAAAAQVQESVTKTRQGRH
jgi:ABC-type glycerol-3-phosphate transport system substrate-binding protein